MRKAGKTRQRMFYMERQKEERKRMKEEREQKKEEQKRLEK